MQNIQLNITFKIIFSWPSSCSHIGTLPALYSFLCIWLSRVQIWLRQPLTFFFLVPTNFYVLNINMTWVTIIFISPTVSQPPGRDNKDLCWNTFGTWYQALQEDYLRRLYMILLYYKNILLYKKIILSTFHIYDSCFQVFVLFGLDIIKYLHVHSPLTDMRESYLQGCNPSKKACYYKSWIWNLTSLSSESMIFEPFVLKVLVSWLEIRKGILHVCNLMFIPNRKREWLITSWSVIGVLK